MELQECPEGLDLLDLVAATLVLLQKYTRQAAKLNMLRPRKRHTDKSSMTRHFRDIFYKPHQIQAVKMFRKSLLFASTRTGNAQSRSKLPLCLVSQFLFEVSQGGTLHCVHVKEVPRCHKMRTITSNTSPKQSRKQHPDASTQKSRTSTFVWQVPTRTFASLKAWRQKDFLPC